MTASGWSTPFLRRQLADARLGVAAFTAPTTLYLGFTVSVLSKSASTMPVPSVECVGNGYQRTAIPMNGTTWSVSDATATSTNIATLGLFFASATWVTPGPGFFLSDALSGGNFYFTGELTDSSGNPDPVLPVAGQQVVFTPGFITFTLAAAS